MAMRPAPPRPGEPPRPQAIPANPNGPPAPGNQNAAGTSVTSSQGFHGTSAPAGASSHGAGHLPANSKTVRIGQYELGSTLGVGSFGKVKRECFLWFKVQI